MIDQPQKTKFPGNSKVRFLAACSVAAILAVGLGAAPQAPAQAPHASTPRMLENGAPFSFADLVERVSPAVVTVTVEEQVAAQQGVNPDALPEPLRDFFNHC